MGGTGRADVDLLGPVGVEEFHGLPQLGAPDDAVVHKEELLALNELMDGDLLHFGHPVPFLWLVGMKLRGQVGVYLMKGRAKGMPLSLA